MSGQAFGVEQGQIQPETEVASLWFVTTYGSASTGEYHVECTLLENLQMKEMKQESRIKILHGCFYWYT